MLDVEELKKLYDDTRKEMYQAAKKLDFVLAARLRDEAQSIEERINSVDKKK